MSEVHGDIDRDLDNHMGWLFERICREWAARFSSHPPFAEATELGAYWTRKHDVEIDIVARKGSRYLAFGSCKWSARADTHALDALETARARVPRGGSASLFVFARGFHPALVERAAQSDVTLVGIDQLFA